MNGAWEKVNKSEFYVALAAIAATLIAPQLGMEPETLQGVLLNLLGIAGLYTAGRAYAKPREELAKASAGKPQQPSAL